MTIRARTIHAATLVLCTTALAGAQEGLRNLSATQMQEDFFKVTEAFQSMHAGLHRYTSAEELEEAYGEAFSSMEEELTVLEFYRVLCEVVSLVRCGHTGVQMSAADLRAAVDGRGAFPLEIHLAGERAWVRAKLEESIPVEPGVEILSIDGGSIAEIRTTAFARMSGDGFIETGKERLLEREFPTLLPVLVAEHDGSSSYRVELAGSAVPLELAGLSLQELGARRTARPSRPVIGLEIHDGESLGVLTVRTFGDPPAPAPSFPETLEACFAELRAKEIRHLVLDLRGNGGGRDMYGALLVSYMAEEPFGYFDRIEVTEDYAGDVEVIDRNGMRLMMSHRGLEIQAPARLRFPGDVHILTDGWTFSTAADVATVAHHNGLATFVGEETGGGYDGNTSGDSERLVLGFSGFVVGCPKWMYTTANVGHDLRGRGAPPDTPLHPTIKDVLAGRDAELEFVRERLRGN